MSQDTPNPYQSPTQQSLGIGGAEPSARTAQLLMQTRPWVKLIGILMFIMIGLMILGCVFLIVAGANQVGPAQGMLMGAIYFVFAILYFFPALFLMRYASRIDAFVQDGTTDRLDHALEAQKSFWKFIGIMAAIITALYAVMALVGILFAILGARG